MYLVSDKDYIAHHGVKGQKWGIRRYRNEDGTLTEAGKKRYRKTEKTVFVSGSSKTQDNSTTYFRKDLPKEIVSELDNHIRLKNKIIVGDAPGIDRQVQDYLRGKNYSNVEIYGPGKSVRYAADRKWKTNPIDAPEYEEYSKEWLAKKDIAMTNMADVGLAVVLENGGAGATRRNVERLISQNKDVKVYELHADETKDAWL